MERLPTLKSAITGEKSLTLNLVWANGAQDTVDLTGLIRRSQHFKVFAENPETFCDMSVTEFGGGVEWKNGLDYSAVSLKLLADKQRLTSGTK